jgi:hypothetical protein
MRGRWQGFVINQKELYVFIDQKRYSGGGPGACPLILCFQLRSKEYRHYGHPQFFQAGQ